MQSDPPPTASLVWFGVYAIISMAGAAYYWLGTNASTKRDTFPWFLLGNAVLFLSVATFGLELPPVPLVFITVILVLITTRNIFAITFCARCARLIDRGLVFRRDRFCPRCGAPLDNTGAARGR